MKKLLIILLMLCPLLLFANDFKLTKSSIKVKTYSEDDIDDGSTFTPGIYITSKIDELKIYVNGNEFRDDSLFLKDLEPGNYYIKLKKSGYISEDLWIKLEEDKYVEITVSLEREAGYLNLELNAKDYQVYLNGILITYGRPIPSGLYKLKIKSFGFEEYTENIIIIHDRVTKITKDLDKAEFKFTGIKSDKERFNPLAYGSFSINRITVGVNAPETGKYKIIDNKNNTILEEKIEFDNWEVSIDINGIANGILLEDGIYKIQFVSNDLSIDKKIIVDSKLYIKSIPVNNKLSGLILSPTGEINSIDVFQTSMNMVLKSDFNVIDLSFTGSNSYGLSLFGGLDIGFKDKAEFLELYGGFKAGAKFNTLFISTQINYNFNTTVGDEDPINKHNIGFYLPLTLSYGWLNFTLSPGINYQINGEMLKLASGGLHFDNQLIRAGISSTASTYEFNQYSIDFGGEFNILLGKSQSYLGVNLKSNKDFDFSGGFGFHLLY